MKEIKIPNRLIHATSPYLLEHAYNPVQWYPWGEEAFARAKAEDKPVFLSIGYSTCHWCHVMARESFEDGEVAQLLNDHFIPIKVDREERPDVDSVYMAVCQAFTGSGGWPTSIFMTPERKPFFAGTYFPKTARYGGMGFIELLEAVHRSWEKEREALVASAEGVLANFSGSHRFRGDADQRLLDSALVLYKDSFDETYGGFGNAPKFPAAHNLLFLLTHYEKSGDAQALGMAEKTLEQMYRGGLFDHIGYGFCRYSTDRYFLAPHFEKMLYDNALMILAYSKAYAVTKKPLYRRVAEKTAAYILWEMTAPEGGFYSAQDADSEGVEGKYYLFEPYEILALLGEEAGTDFNRRYDVTKGGNFEGKSIPNLLQSREEPAPDAQLRTVYAYRKRRVELRLDDKILTAWNGLMIAALCGLYRVSKNAEYLLAAQRAQAFIEKELCLGDTLFVSFRAGKRGERGFLDDYASYIFALIGLYEATLEAGYLERAAVLCEKVAADFSDPENGGFFLYGKGSEDMIFRPKEVYDGATPSGNSLMAYNLVRLGYYMGERFSQMEKAQLSFMAGAAQGYPPGYAMFLTALSDYVSPPTLVTAVLGEEKDLDTLREKLPLNALPVVLKKPEAGHPLKDGRTTFYICRGQSCLPPRHDLDGLE